MSSWYGQHMGAGGWIVMAAGLLAVLALLVTIASLLVQGRPRRLTRRR